MFSLIGVDDDGFRASAVAAPVPKSANERQNGFCSAGTLIPITAFFSWADAGSKDRMMAVQLRAVVTGLRIGFTWKFGLTQGQPWNLNVERSGDERQLY
ncbi:hypothetical protein [Mesorhizobium sp. ES1-4]|uniref:hypothetical protein n=1 Tax=Mesorhizobium sp. ES1-4 TaxID=2876627 RepID=UPI001CC9AB38|nr:hypothetical protein [Mesorhizobium sp. ES1-4]MBZ9799122.1 hypothetical protein [Mesorhizobium sp. ES1-4]